MTHPAFAQQIILLKKADLELRQRLIREGRLQEGYNEEMEHLHRQNAKVLEEIIRTIGYPTIDKVGPEASDAAWLVIQHAIGQPAFMRKCAGLLENAVIHEKGSAVSLAYLTDRIASFEERPQLYGTQFDWDENGELSPKPFDDLHRVNQRRASIGLNTLEEQTLLIRRQAREDNQSPPSDFEERKKEIWQWKKKVGWLE